jgi:phenylacetate-coenzyme A ligase PaaK-like adenylate-forming protein
MPSFSDAETWNSGPQYYSTIEFPDVNGDGRADVCGRGGGGVYCALSSGTTFGPATLWQPSFSDVNGWNSGPQYYSTIRFNDVNGDGRADVCGRGSTGVYCALSSGTTFGSAALWGPDFSDANGWNSGPQYYSTIRLP